MAELESPASSRWELYRVLSEPARLRLLALASDEELSIGELAELLDEGQPNVSRHAAALRQAGLLRDRREGTRTLVRMPADAGRDPVVADALASGRALCQREGRLARVADVLRARDAAAHEFFARPGKTKVDAIPAEMGAYLASLALLLPRRTLAVDAGTGEGRLLDLLAPVYERVVAIDRSTEQLARARERVASRGYTNVTLVQAELDSDALRKEAGEGADAVFAVRLLHHTPQPARIRRASSHRYAAPVGRWSSSTTRATRTNRCESRRTRGSDSNRRGCGASRVRRASTTSESRRYRPRSRATDLTNTCLGRSWWREKPKKEGSRHG